MYIDGELKGLESCLKNDLDGPDTSFHKLHSYDEKKDLYLSPESFESLCRG